MSWRKAAIGSQGAGDPSAAAKTAVGPAQATLYQAVECEELLMKLGAARDQSRTAWRLVVVEVAADSATFSYQLDRNKPRQAQSRKGRYLLRSNLVAEDPAKLWSQYLLLVAV